MAAEEQDIVDLTHLEDSDDDGRRSSATRAELPGLSASERRQSTNTAIDNKHQNQLHGHDITFTSNSRPYPAEIMQTSNRVSSHPMELPIQDAHRSSAKSSNALQHDSSDPGAKRQKISAPALINSENFISELSCLFTLELPVDPVIATDGRVYERSAIQTWFKTNKTSPYTSKTLKSTNLVPALQHRKIIEIAIRLGYIQGPSAKNWLAGRAQQTDETSQLASETLEDALICPLTEEFPWNPVVAENGMVYNQSVVDKHFAPALQHKNIIELCIQHRYIQDGPLVEKWHMIPTQKRECEVLLKEAERGDVNAMEKIAEVYEMGKHGFRRDAQEAFNWYQRAMEADKKNKKKIAVLAMASVGDMLCEGTAGRKNVNRGTKLIANAALLGSDFALYKLAIFHAEGKCGYEVDEMMAIDLFEKSQSTDCKFQDMSDELNTDAKTRKAELLAKNGLPNGLETNNGASNEDTVSSDDDSA